MGQCITDNTLNQRQQEHPIQFINPYGINTSNIPNQPANQLSSHQYFELSQNDSNIPVTNSTLQKKVSQHTTTINQLTQKIKQQEIKLKQQDQILKNKLNNKNQNNPSNEYNNKQHNSYLGCRNFGKQNILQFKNLCCNCKVNKMNRFLDYSSNKFDCKCEGYGTTEGKKTSVRCSQNFCWNYITSLEICLKCYGYGFRFNKKWYENIF